MLLDLIFSILFIISVLPTFISLVCIMYFLAFIFLLYDFIYRQISLLITPLHNCNIIEYWIFLLRIPFTFLYCKVEKYVFLLPTKKWVCIKTAKDAVTCWGLYLHDLLGQMDYWNWLCDTHYGRFPSTLLTQPVMWLCQIHSPLRSQPALNFIFITGFHSVCKHNE